MRAVLTALAIGLALGFGGGWRVHDWKTTAATVVEQSQAETDRLLRQANTIRVETKALDRRAKDAETLAAILRGIDRELPNACVLPPAVRVLHDAAARGENPATTPIGDAAPVSAADLTETTVRNYDGARRNEGQLEDCQRYIRDNGLEGIDERTR